jgi:hypothetical protein
MATTEEESRKLLCSCGKHLGTFTAQGLGIKCRRCPDTTIVPYGISNLQQAISFVQRRRRRGRGPEEGPGA